MEYGSPLFGRRTGQVPAAAPQFRPMFLDYLGEMKKASSSTRSLEGHRHTSWPPIPTGIFWRISEERLMEDSFLFRECGVRPQDRTRRTEVLLLHPLLPSAGEPQHRPSSATTPAFRRASSTSTYSIPHRPEAGVPAHPVTEGYKSRKGLLLSSRTTFSISGSLSSTPTLMRLSAAMPG